MRLFSSLLLCFQIASAQTAITALTSFWEMDIDAADRVAWDYHGHSHAMYLGAGIDPQTSIFGAGIGRTDIANGNGGLSIPSRLIDFNGSFCWAAWVRHDGAAKFLSRFNTGTNPRSWELSFSASTSGRLVLKYAMANNSDATLTMPGDAGNLVNAGDLALAWFAYDHTTGKVKIAINATAWTEATPASPFVASVDRPLDIAHQLTAYDANNAIVGRTMYWRGYIPSEAERSAIYNSGNGREYTYFNVSGFTKPIRPLTVSLESSAFLDDASLTGQQGLYFIKVYPLREWSPSLATTFGHDYLWARSTDHATGEGGIFIGGSSSPDVAPTSWTKIKDAADLSMEDPGANWDQLETPWLVWNPANSTIYLYCHAGKEGTGNPYIQTTHVYTSTNLAAWTWQGVALPNSPSTYHHTGYASVYRLGASNWEARSLLATGEAGSVGVLYGIWSSSDGIAWTFSREYVINEWPFPSTYGDAHSAESVDSGMMLGVTNAGGRLGYVAYRGSSAYSPSYPRVGLVYHGGTGIGTDWLQGFDSYVKSDGTVYIYAKWSFREPSTVRLYKGTLNAKIYSDLVITDTANSRKRSWGGNHWTAGRQWLTMRVALKNSDTFDGSETTYCELTNATRCWAAGVLQGATELNLSTFTHYRIEYRDSHGRLVSAGLAGSL